MDRGAADPASAFGLALPRFLAAIVAATVAAVLLSTTVADSDLWGHVRYGLDILHARGLVADRYSFTADRPWINHEWLAEVIMAASWTVMCRFSEGRDPGFSKPFPPEVDSSVRGVSVPQISSSCLV